MACAGAAWRVGDGREADLFGRLRSNISKMRVAIAQDDPARYHQLNVEFHERLMNTADNASATAISENLVKEIHLFRRRGLSDVPSMARSLQEHEAIAKAGCVAARGAALAHISACFERCMTIAEADADTSSGSLPATQ